MNIKPEYILRQIAGTWIIFSLEKNPTPNKGVLTLNDSGALLWNLLSQGCEEQQLLQVLTSEYDVSAQQAKTDLDQFLKKLEDIGCLVR